MIRIPMLMKINLLKTLLTRLYSEEFFSGFLKTNPVNVPSAAAALDGLFFVVRVLNERHESHSLAN